MAKPRSAKQVPDVNAVNGGALGDLAEELGAFLGKTEKTAVAWLAQRKKVTVQQRKRVTEQLTAIRDQATSLLERIGSGIPKLPIPRLPRKRGSKKTAGSAVPPEIAGQAAPQQTRSSRATTAPLSTGTAKRRAQAKGRRAKRSSG